MRAREIDRRTSGTELLPQKEVERKGHQHPVLSLTERASAVRFMSERTRRRGWLNPNQLAVVVMIMIMIFVMALVAVVMVLVPPAMPPVVMMSVTIPVAVPIPSPVSIPIAVRGTIAVPGSRTPCSAAPGDNVAVRSIRRNAVVPIHILHSAFHAANLALIVGLTIALPARVITVKTLLIAC